MRTLLICLSTIRDTWEVGKERGKNREGLSCNRLSLVVQWNRKGTIISFCKQRVPKLVLTLYQIVKKEKKRKKIVINCISVLSLYVTTHFFQADNTYVDYLFKIRITRFMKVADTYAFCPLLMFWRVSRPIRRISF